MSFASPPARAGSLPFLLGVLLLLLAPALTAAQHDHGGHSNGMDPSMDMPMTLAHGHMTAFLHFRPGDTLWFEGWVPGKGSSMFAACVGLFLLGIAERWTAALRAGVESAIRREVLGSAGRRKGREDTCIGGKVHPLLRDLVLMRGGTVAPFIVGHAWARFILHGAQAMFTALFMLTVMTFQVGFILSLVAGAGVGEMMYGRFTDAALTQEFE
ncbi:hypothetical protein D9615_007066 [Tricholomella constricta]|uniref:Copper transport protein n=1 Tax=Tricholomella constricta TaxID=117010 RepID=A0A8H5M2M9_9AGAR|nr:hypothetical protein D9615_007066 [Tricholomella constricta]